MLLGIFLLVFLIVKVITQYKYNKFNSKKENTVTKYRRLPFGIKDHFTQDSLDNSIDIFASSFNNDLYSV